MKEKIILNIHFETGDGTLPHYSIPVVLESRHTCIDNDLSLQRRIEDELRRVEDTSDDYTYEDIVEDAMNTIKERTGQKWNWLEGTVDGVIAVWNIFID